MARASAVSSQDIAAKFVLGQPTFLRDIDAVRLDRPVAARRLKTSIRSKYSAKRPKLLP